jgi:hypothetical protein
MFSFALPLVAFSLTARVHASSSSFNKRNSKRAPDFCGAAWDEDEISAPEAAVDDDDDDDDEAANESSGMRASAATRRLTHAPRIDGCAVTKKRKTSRAALCTSVGKIEAVQCKSKWEKIRPILIHKMQAFFSFSPKRLPKP